MILYCGWDPFTIALVHGISFADPLKVMVSSLTTMDNSTFGEGILKETRKRRTVLPYPSNYIVHKVRSNSAEVTLYEIGKPLWVMFL